MSTTGSRCPRCNSAMEPGFVMDRGHYSTPSVSTWVEGAPERSFWSGLKTKGRDLFPVMSHRCEGCGFLEFYANPAEPK